MAWPGRQGKSGRNGGHAHRFVSRSPRPYPAVRSGDEGFPPVYETVAILAVALLLFSIVSGVVGVRFNVVGSTLTPPR